ncbi:RNA polymerase sigma factor SigK [Streptomyces viridochromogenes DSM 40736]|uniref:RNA polymerase sigma factor SigK n=1 Tax=Streptomyces viridochromogenes (strain DSM 40736 / JCM 4977 / BCRC 1201 / Tue 494) TaxID=591159 RepID=D9XGF4_STRVT|nr:RNA polymerase sigma factor SigK [Streptomyces viridochromogenes DSM 40736]
MNQLLVRAADGDEQAFAGVYDALADRVMGLVCRVVRDKAQAEEVTQDVMVEVWRTADRFHPARGAARNWVLTLAHRRAVDRVRSVSANRARELRAAVREQERSFDTVAEEVEVREEQRVVFRCLALLSRELRLPLVLAYYEGLTYAEVAEALSTPEGTIKSRMRQGLQRLHDCLEAGS